MYISTYSNGIQNLFRRANETRNNKIIFIYIYIHTYTHDGKQCNLALTLRASRLFLQRGGFYISRYTRTIHHRQCQKHIFAFARLMVDAAKFIETFVDRGDVKWCKCQKNNILWIKQNSVITKETSKTLNAKNNISTLIFPEELRLSIFEKTDKQYLFKCAQHFVNDIFPWWKNDGYFSE